MTQAEEIAQLRAELAAERQARAVAEGQVALLRDLVLAKTVDPQAQRRREADRERKRLAKAAKSPAPQSPPVAIPQNSAESAGVPQSTAPLLPVPSPSPSVPSPPPPFIPPPPDPGPVGARGEPAALPAAEFDLGAPARTRPTQRGDAEGEGFVAMRDGLVAAYRDETGAAYAFAGAKDAQAVKRLLRCGLPREEVLSRWQRSLRLGSTYPGTRGIALFESRLNEFGPPSASRPVTPAEDRQRRAPIRAGDVDWSRT